jgi:hypothetical protein
LKGCQIEGVSHGGSGARSRNENLQIQARIDPEEIGSGIEEEIFCVISGEVWRTCTGGMDSIDPTIGTEGRFPLHHTVIAATARHTPVPKDLVPRSQQIPVDVPFLSTNFCDFSDPLMTKDHRQSNARILSLPLMNIRTADSGGLDLHEDFTFPELRNRKNPKDEGLIKFFEDHGSSFHRNPFAIAEVTHGFRGRAVHPQRFSGESFIP